jgi:phosphoribosylanthranilate isomerase
MKQKLRIKVCGMKYTANREAVEQLPIDYLGFIFYPESKRFVGNNPDPRLFNTARHKVAVFVDGAVLEIIRIAQQFGFEYIQLHGKENPETCRILRDYGLKVIKAFNLNEKFNFSLLEPYESHADYFLFDTKTYLPGGSGEKFNWDILKSYSGSNHFFLSGGIKPEDTEKIRHLYHPKLFGIDLNSGFEDEPGLKNIRLLSEFTDRIAGKRI